MGHSSGASSLYFTPPIRLVHTDRGNRNHTRPCKVRTETPGMPMKKGQPHQETVLSSYIVYLYYSAFGASSAGVSTVAVASVAGASAAAAAPPFFERRVRVFLAALSFAMFSL